MKILFPPLTCFVFAMIAMCSSGAVPSHDDSNLLWYDKPAEKWVQALPVGNGRLGAMIFGGTTNEHVQLNDITLWSGGPQTNANRTEAWTHLKEIRQVIREGRYDEAEKLCNKFFTCQANYDVSKYQTLGDLNLEFQLPAGPVTNYSRWLDIDAAVAGVKFTAGKTEFQREIFASAPDKVLVQRLTASQPGQLNFNLKLSRPEKSQTKFVAPDMLVMTGETAGSNLSFQVNARVLLKGGKVTGQGDVIKVEGATEALVLLTANTSYVMDYARGYKGVDPAQATIQMQAAASKSFKQLKQAHVADYQKYFHRVTLDLGTTPAAKLSTITPWALNPPYGMSFDKWGPNHRNTRSVKQLWDAVPIVADYRGIAFGMNDGHEEQIGGERMELAYYAFRDPAYVPLIEAGGKRDLIYGMPELPEVTEKPCLKSGVAENLGFALLRSQTTNRPPCDQIEAVFKIGTQGGFHGHFDRCSLDALMRYGRSFWNPERIWWGYGNFMYKFYVQNSVNHNMVVVDQLQQEAVPSSQLLFYSGKMMQVSAQETDVRWSDPPYGGMVYTAQDSGGAVSSLPALMKRDKQSFPLVTNRVWAELGPFSDRVLQRRLGIVTDDYIVIADYLKAKSRTRLTICFR